MSDRSWMTSVTFLRGLRAISLLPLLLIGLLVLFVPTDTTAAFLKISAQQSDDIRPLKAGDTIQRALAAGESHLYQSRLESGQYFELSIQQRGIGLVVTLIGPDGAATNQIIVPNDQNVLMTLSLITKSAGDTNLRSRRKKGLPRRANTS